MPPALTEDKELARGFHWGLKPHCLPPTTSKIEEKGMREIMGVSNPLATRRRKSGVETVAHIAARLVATINKPNKERKVFMGQEYIHCSRRGLDSMGRSKSGYSVRVHLDVASMLHAGMEIYSSNDELVTAGDYGVVCPCHFKMAQTSSGERLDFQCCMH